MCVSCVSNNHGVYIQYLTGKGAAACGATDAEVVAHMSFELPATYKFHKQKSVDIQVGL